jgi:hypothetical protein
MTEQAQEPHARLSLKVTVPLMTQLLRDNPESHVHLTKQIMSEAMKKVSIESVVADVEAATKRTLETFKNDVTCEIAKNLGATVKKCYNRADKWEMSDDLRERIRSNAQLMFRNEIREALRTEELKLIIADEAKRSTDYILTQSLDEIIDRRIRKTLYNLGSKP